MDIDTLDSEFPLETHYPDSKFDWAPYFDSETDYNDKIFLNFRNKQIADVLGNRNGYTSLSELWKWQQIIKSKPQQIVEWKSPLCFLTFENGACASKSETFQFNPGTHKVALYVTDLHDYSSELLWPNGTNFSDIYWYLLDHKPSEPTPVATSPSRSTRKRLAFAE